MGSEQLLNPKYYIKQSYALRFQLKNLSKIKLSFGQLYNSHRLISYLIILYFLQGFLIALYLKVILNEYYVYNFSGFILVRQKTNTST